MVMVVTVGDGVSSSGGSGSDEDGDSGEDSDLSVLLKTIRNVGC